MAKELDDIRRVYDYFETNEIPAVTGDGFAKMALMGAMSKEEGRRKKEARRQSWLLPA